MDLFKRRGAVRWTALRRALTECDNSVSASCVKATNHDASISLYFKMRKSRQDPFNLCGC